MKTKLLKLSEIVTAAGTQIRAKIDAETVDQYAEAMQDATNKFPPVVVYHDGSQFILADGFHRVMAASRNGFLDIEADVRKGTRADALRYALSANSTHGLKRTNADKRRSVELASAEWPKMTGKQLSDICAVSINFACEFLKEKESSSDEPCTRIGRDGKERKLPTRKPSPALPEPEPETAEAQEPQSKYTPQEQEFLSAVGVSDARNFFASQLEDVIESIIADASDEQLSAAILTAETGLQKMRREQKSRKTA